MLVTDIQATGYSFKLYISIWGGGILYTTFFSNLIKIMVSQIDFNIQTSAHSYLYMAAYDFIKFML